MMDAADNWTSEYGSSVYLVWIFDNEQKADDAVEVATVTESEDE